MKPISPLFAALVYLLGCTGLQAQYITPNPISESYPFRLGMLMDGGTFFVYELAKGHPNTKAHPDVLCYYFDGKRDSQTAGEFLSGAPGDKIEKPKVLSWLEAETVFAHYEKSLVTYFGKEKLAKLKTHPLAESEERAKDPHYNDQIATQWLIKQIILYEVGKAGKAAGSRAAKDGYGPPFCAFSPSDFPWTLPADKSPIWKTETYAAWASKIKAYLRTHASELGEPGVWVMA